MMLLPVIHTIVAVLAVLVLVPILVFCLQTVLAVLPRRRFRPLGTAETTSVVLSPFAPRKPRTFAERKATVVSTPPPEEAPRPRAAVLIPAHNEQLLIGQTLRALMPGLAPGDRVLVVADNCDDRTAEIARAAGAQVVQRNDPSRRGKGYALDYGLHALGDDPPDVVVVIDADCLVAAGTLDLLARAAARTQRPVQALDLTDRHAAAGPIQAVAALANRFTNLIRPLGLARLGLPCRLMGTGMAIPWALVGGIRPSGGNLVEDMQLGIDLALRGHPPLFLPEARVTSALPPDGTALVGQQRRWEHGHLRTAMAQVPRLLAAALRRRSPGLLAMALDLSIPPLSLLASVWLAATVGAALLGLFGAAWLPAAVLAAGGVLLAGSIAAGWAVFCRRQVPLAALACVPWYVIRKLPIYLGFLLCRPQSWVRTRRGPALSRESSEGNHA